MSWKPLLYYQTRILCHQLSSMSRKSSLKYPRIHHRQHGNKSWIGKPSCALFRMASYLCTHHHMIHSYPCSCTMPNKILPHLKCIFPSNLTVDLVPVRFISLVQNALSLNQHTDTTEIGLVFTIFGFFCMFIPLLLVGILNRYFPVLRVFQYSCSVGILPIYFATPFTTLLPNPANFIVLSILFALKGCICDFGYISGSILVARSCKIDNGRGKVNGLQSMVSAMARIIGPLWAGSMLDLGARLGYIGMGFWAGPALAVTLALLPLSLMTDD